MSEKMIMESTVTLTCNGGRELKQSQIAVELKIHCHQFELVEELFAGNVLQIAEVPVVKFMDRNTYRRMGWQEVGWGFYRTPLSGYYRIKAKIYVAPIGMTIPGVSLITVEYLDHYKRPTDLLERIQELK